MKRTFSVLVLFVVVLFLFSGCGKKQDDVIKIGAILPLTGENAVYGEAIRNGMLLALEEYNLQHKDKDRIKLIIEDDQAIPANTVSAYNKLTRIEKVSFILGGVFSSSTLAIAPLAEKDSVVLLSPTSSAIELTNAGDFIFRIYPSDSYDGLYLSNFVATKMDYSRVAILYIQVASVESIVEVFTSNFEKNGGKVVYSAGYSEGTTDFRTQLKQIKEANPGVIFLPGYLREMSLQLKQIRELGIELPIVSISTFYDPQIFELAGESAEGVIFSTPRYDPTSNQDPTKTFVESYKDKYRIEPNIWAGYGYDVVKIAAIAAQNSDNNSTVIKNALYAIKNYPGVTGNTTFDKNGDVLKDLKLMTVKNGKFVDYEKNN